MGLLKKSSPWFNVMQCTQVGRIKTTSMDYGSTKWCIYGHISSYLHKTVCLLISPLFSYLRPAQLSVIWLTNIWMLMCQVMPVFYPHILSHLYYAYPMNYSINDHTHNYVYIHIYKFWHSPLDSRCIMINYITPWAPFNWQWLAKPTWIFGVR